MKFTDKLREWAKYGAYVTFIMSILVFIADGFDAIQSTKKEVV